MTFPIKSKRATVAVCYEVVTHESAEHGDAEDRGFEIERRPYEQWDLRDFCNNYGPFHSRKETGSEWFCSVSHENIRTGARTEYTIHFEGVTASSLGRLERLLVRGRC